MGEKIKLVVSSLCIFQWVATLFGMAYSSTTPMVQDLDRSPEIMVLRCPETALSDFNASHFNNGLLLPPRDSKGDLAVAAAAGSLSLSRKCLALNLKNLEVQASTGPQASMEDDDIIGTGEKAQVPIISFATSKSLTFFHSSNFIRIAHNNSSRENTISAIGQPFRWREMSNDLFWIRTGSIVNGLTSTSSLLFNSKQAVLGLRSSVPVSIELLFNSKQAVLGLRSSIPVSIELKNFSDQWRRNFQHNPTIDNPQLNVFGQYGYDIAGSLAMAGELVEAGSFGYQKANSSQSLNLMGSLVIRNALSNTSLEGFNRKSGLNIFMAILKKLSSAEVSEFTSSGKPINETAATYNGLMNQVYAMNLASFVGDTTVKDPTDDVCCSLGVSHWLVCIYFYFFISSVVWILVKLANDYFEPQTRQTRTIL